MIFIVAPSNNEDIYQNLSEFAAIEPPIWAGMLAKALQANGQSVYLLDQQAMSVTDKQVVEMANTLQPQLIVIVVYGHQPSASTQTMHAASRLCNNLQETGFPILMVGGHVSALPEETLRKENLYYAAKGEGLNVILRMVKDEVSARPTTYYEIPGLYVKWRHNDQDVIIHPRSQDRMAQNLDQTYPGVLWHQFYKTNAKYRAHNWHVFEKPQSINSYASIYTSLGCPYKCTFCCINAPFDGSSFRYWTPSFTVSQIKLLAHEYGIQNLKIADEMFVLKEAHFMEICRLLIEQKIEMNIWAYARIDTIKPRYLETLKKAGVNWLALGIESGSKHVRDGVTKGQYKFEDIIKIVELIKSHGIYVIGNYIFGLPDDTEESMRDTYNLATELNCEFANFYSAMAYPGSQLYTSARREDLPSSYLGFSQHSAESKPLPTRTVSSRRVLEIRDEAHARYFKRPEYLSMLKTTFGEGAVRLVEKMNAVTLKRNAMADTAQSESQSTQTKKEHEVAAPSAQ